ncbi:MAG: DGQHR domain-containing protein [Chloroflexi bacterium]|nr:DGQHR domain-containing protein [Chloroflexota bacterium]
MNPKTSVRAISVIVPANPFVPSDLQNVRHCLAALNVEKLMQWWPGQPHTPHRNPNKVRAIQRSLDWKRVTQIAAYLLQREIVDSPDRLDSAFRDIYEPRSMEPGREWPPRVPRVVGFQRSEYPTFSNVLLHVNGAKVLPIPKTSDGAAKLVFDEADPTLNFSVIDGQHRVNGAYFAVKILHEEKPGAVWEIPAEIFLDLDAKDQPPRRQAQIFIDVNFYQKKVDRSLVADLFPTARGPRGPLDNKERAQDLGRKLMLEVGPLVGMIQIPGIKFGVKDVVTLATLNSAVEDILDDMFRAEISSLDAQAALLAQCLEAWLEATGRKQEVSGAEGLDADNVAYQGRVVVSFLTLLPACIWRLKKAKLPMISDEAKEALTKWLVEVMERAGLLDAGRFLAKKKFKEKGFLGSGGLARFRDTLWAAVTGTNEVSRLGAERLLELAEKHRQQVRSELANP